MASNVYKTFCRSKACVVKNEMPKYRKFEVEIKSFERMKGPMPLPLWQRCLPLIGIYSMDKMHHAYARFYRESGCVFRENLFGHRPQVHCLIDKDMKTVYENEGELPERPSYRALAKYRNERPEKYSGPGLFASNGDEWQRFRQLFQNILDDASICEAYSNSLEEVTDDLVSKIEYQLDGGSLEVDVQPLIFSWAVECMGMVILNRRFGCLYHEGNTMAQGLIYAANDIRMSIYKTEYSPLRFKKNYKILEKAHNYFACVVEKCINQVLEENTDGDNKALLIKMMQHGKASRKDIFTMILDMFLAGIEKTSYAASFALYNLATNRRVQEKLRDELVSNFPRKKSRMSNPPILIPYLQQVIRESLRMNPVFICTRRIIPTDLVLGEYHVPAKTSVVLQNQIASMMGFNFYDATDFCPERFLSDAPQKDVTNPFGRGPRMCLGQRIATRELEFLIAKLIRNFYISYHRKRIGFYTKLINVPDRPVRLRFQSAVI